VHDWAFSPNQIIEMLSSSEFLSALSLVFRSMFTHFSQNHLLGNMIPLLAVGIVITRQNGPLEFVFTYLAGGFLAAALTISLTPASWAPLPIVGASGAAAALYGFYLFDRAKSASGKDRIYLFVLPLVLSVSFIAGRFFGHEAEFLPQIFQWLIIVSFVSGVFIRPRQRFWVTAICLWIIANIYNFILTTGGVYVTGSAHLLHICGVATGILLAYLNSKRHASSRPGSRSESI
ncbi:MAG: rhomboid family intramembrane serine protease, partial [Candidatus Obscuribacterales bacterium]|nr:rhomboid family intramembrane serine protease [Candidatus Obscuribacterales bacterium]